MSLSSELRNMARSIWAGQSNLSSMHKDTSAVVHASNEAKMDAFVDDYVVGSRARRIGEPVGPDPNESSSAYKLKVPKCKASSAPGNPRKLRYRKSLIPYY